MWLLKVRDDKERRFIAVFSFGRRMNEFIESSSKRWLRNIYVLKSSSLEVLCIERNSQIINIYAVSRSINVYSRIFHANARNKNVQFYASKRPPEHDQFSFFNRIIPNAHKFQLTTFFLVPKE